MSEANFNYFVVWEFEREDKSTFEMRDSLLFSSKTVCKNYAESQTFNFVCKLKNYYIKEVVAQ